MIKSYQPVSCALHSELELAIIRKNYLELIYLDDKLNQSSIRILPVDIETTHGEEFLSSKSVAGEILRIRLDHIINIQSVNQVT